MATPNQTQQAAVAYLEAQLPGLATCAAYAGEFAGTEITRASVKCPAVLVACLGVTREKEVECGQVDWRCRFAAYCLTRNAAGREQRAVSALELAEQVLAKIDKQRFGLTGVFAAKVARLDNLYAAKFDKASMAIWAVTWEQTVRLGEDEWAAEGTRPESLYVGFAPEIGAEHEDDYVLVYQEEQP